MRTRTYLVFMAVLGAGCVHGADGFQSAALPRPSATASSADEASKFTVKQPFPDEARLQDLTSKGAADPSHGLGDAPAKVDRWMLTEPLPGVAGALAFRSSDRDRTRAAEVIGRHSSGLQPTAALMCVAQEHASFRAAHDRPPPVDIEMFIAGRCGSTVTQLHFQFIEINAKIDTKRFLASESHMRKLLGDLPARSQVGIGWDDTGGNRLYVVASGVPDVEIEPVKLDLADGSPVVIRGRVQWPIEWLSAHVTRGELGVERCAPLPGVSGRNDEFALECSVDSKDPLAFIEVYAAPRGALLGRSVLTLAVSPDGSAPLEYAAVVHPLPVDGEDRRPEALVAGLNAVRERAKQDPLRLSTEQSSVAQNLFAHLQGQTELEVRNEIALGIMAGWQVEGTIREGGFKISPANREWTLERMIAGSLVSPSFRASALDPTADVVAIGQVESSASDVRAVLWATYDMFEPSDFADEEELVLEELDAQRASVGLGPVMRIEGRSDRKLLEDSARRIRMHETTPPEELRIVVRHFAETQHRNFQGVVMAPMRLEGWRPQFPAELLEADEIAVATTISFFKPEGAAWGQHVVLLAYTKAAR